MAQVNDNDDIKWLYGKLKAKGYNIGSEAEFKSSLANGEDRKWYYEKAKGMGLDMGSMDDFESMYAPKAAPAPKKGTPSSGQQKPAVTPAASSAPAKQQPKKDQPLTPAQRQAMIDQVQQMQQQTQAMIADTNERMNNMKEYGVGLGFGQTKKSGYKVNPRTGKLEQTYITPTGNRYNNKALADAESFHYRQEASKPLGLNMNDQQVDAAQKPANAAVAALWKEAEAKYAADRNKNAEEVYGGNPWLHAGREMHIVDAATNSHKNEVSHLTRFDLQKMMDNAWGRVGKQMTASCYAQLKKQYPTATEQQLQNSASAMARQLSDNAVYKYAVAKNTPKSTLEFFAKTAADMNLLRTISKGLARSEAGTTGDLAAYEAAMGEYGKNHRWAQIGGTVTGMLFDPTTYISGGVGSFTGKTALNIGGRIVAKKTATNVGARLFGNTLTGRVVAGMAGGAGNLGTYEGIKEGESQWLHGGHINPQTGENEGYSAGDVLKSSLHGTLLGSVTGTVSPLLGNVADKWVKATSNTAGKVGIRAGELATSTVAEGTIFSMPEWISGDGDAMDVWTDNMAMMIGFKGQHMIKSAPRVIAGLRPIENPQTMRERNHNRMSFVERLRKQVDASPRDMAFTKEEREELQKYGYGDLATLFTRTPKQQPKPKSKPTTKDGKVMYLDIPEAEVEDLGKQWLKQHPEFDGYEAMERLMQDPNVSQSARAKAYYILTGRQLPMGSVTGYTTEQDENGNIFVKSVTANGEVVTSRRFADETLAKKEQDKIMRQAELNSVDVGERYTEAKADNKVFEAAVEAVAPGADPETVKRNYQAAKQGDKDAIANYGQMVDAIDKFMEENKGMADTERPEAIRAAIKEETGVDVDEAIKKEPSKRTEPEKAAVQDYIERLFPEQKAENEQPMSEEESAAAAAYDQARLLWDKVEKGDADAKAEVDAITLRMQEAYQMCEDAFGADAEMRIAEINEDPWPLVNNPELSEDQQDAVLYYVNAKAAMEGVMDASNEAADGKRKEVQANVERHTHKDMGVVQPATMKVDDKPVYVVKGNVVMLPDGSGIDVRNSDQSIVICDAETGEYKFASPDQLFSLGEAIDPQTELDEAYANIQAEHEAVLGVPENGENVQGNGENVQNSAENAPQPTDEQLQQYFHSAFNEATQSNGITIPQEQAEQLQQHNQQMLEQEQQRKEEEANRQPTALERVPINEETGEPMFEKADRETALDALNEVTGGNDENTTAIVRAQVEQATKALEALKKKEPTKKAPSLKGSPMAMVKAQQEAEANYNTAMEEYNAQVAAAKENLNAWSRINSLMNDRKRAIREQQEAERKVREEKLHAEAVARLEEDKRIAAEKAAEQEAVGTHAVNPKIKAKWDGATKVEGNPNAITLADGSTIRGHYVLTEAGAATASHDVNNAYEPTEGFPVDENGESVNDRDYKRDKDAQRIVRDMADSYDSRALQTPVIVSKDGVVLSGNNRTMSGDIAAQQGTDKAYIDHLREFGRMYGFTPEQIDGMKHPRVVFVPDEHLPYDAATFARFNAEQQKKQSKPEHAVKLGKIVPDNVFTSITNDISRFDRMSDYYADDKSVASAISQLLDAGVINEMQLPELRTGNALSAAGKELIENTLIGKVFQTSPDAVRQIISTPTLRQSVVMGLNEIANNRTLAKSGYDLSKELAAAVDLVSRAKSDSPDIYKEGMPVSPYGRQQGLFDDEYGDSRVTDGVTLLLADLLNSGKPSDLRKVLSTYNNEAASPAAGQIDMFSGDVTSKEEILKNVNEYFRNATPKEQQALIDAAVAERKRRAEAAESAGGDEASEQATVVAGSDAEPQQPVVASEEPVKGNEADADALAKEAEEKLSERITDTEDEWTEPSEYGEIYKHRMFVDGKEVIKVDAPDKSKNYPGTYYEIDGKQFGDLYEVANYIDGNEQPLSAKIEAASAEVNTDPTEAQKEAGNYKKGHVQVGTFDITIEQPQGSVRKGTDADGKQWESKMNNNYGYIRGAVGVDGDHIDVFLSNDIDGWNGRKVFVVDQYNPDGSFDEHKVMLGFNDQDEAKGDYLANYEQGWENGRRIDITGVNLEDFEKWIESSKRKTKPFGEYSSVKKDVVEINAPEEAGYSITPSTYTNKKGKTSDVSLLTFDHDLTADQERAVKEFAKERTGEGRFAPARGWKDRESGGWMFRSEEDARKAAEMVGNEEAVADNQPMTAQELRDAVEPKKPTTSKKTASKKPANRVESVPTEEPIEPEKPKYEVSDEEMNGLMNDIRDILGIGDDEGDVGFKFRDPDELTAEQRQKLMSVGQRLAMAMVERGNESFGNYASMMVKALGDKVRPWLKAFYGGLEYVPGYDKYALTPYEEVKAFDVENFDKPTKDVMAQANMIVEEGKAQVAAEKANNELKATRNEQRKETEKQTAANTDAVAAEAKSVASEATALAETSSDEQALTGAAERVDETLDKVNEQLALLGYYEADEVEKDYNEAYGYMRNAEKKAVKDAANLASQLIFDLNLNHYEASHSKQTDKKGNRKKKPLAVSNISPIGGDVSIHLPLEEGRELYLTIGVEPRAAKGVEGFGGSDLEVTHIMFRVDHPEGTGNDRYGRNVFVDSNVTYSDLLKQVQREAYKYLIGSGVTNEGEYAAGDKVQYSTDGGRTWTDAVVVQPNDEGGIRIDTGLAPVMWVNAHPDQLRHKPSESAEPKHEADGDFYEDGINEDAVAALPEDTAIQLHVVDILNPGMTDHSMKSKIESLNTLLPKISDKKLSELDKEYGDDKDMGTHIKAEVARRAKDGGVQPTSSEKPADKPKPASKKKATKKVKPEQPVGDLFAGLFDNTSDNGLQGNDEAVRTETVPADNSGQQQGLRESQGSPRKTAAQEGGRPDGGRGGQSTGKDRAVSAGLHGLTQPKNTRNNHSERGADHAPTSVNGRIEANIKAIELAHELLESGETATPEQMSVLRQFSGWGGLGAAFSDGGYDWKQRERNKKIRELLGEEAYEQAVMSANSAYYTPAYVVDTLWDIANQLGFKGGNILEGSAGIGNILGQMPTTVSERSNIHAIEIDGTSGGILSLLYPDAKVEIQGFEQTRIPNGSVDLAITNVPFVTGLRVNDTTGDSDLSKKFHNIHDFCIAKNVRKLHEGGLGIFISSNGTLDNSKALRDWVVNEGGSDFIGAFRMNNKTFGGTTVTSDIIVIRKRVNGQKSAQAIDVSSISGERTAEYEEPGARKAKQLSMDYNKYFIEHPDHMAGEMRFAFEEGDTFRPTSKGLYPVSGKDQGKMLVDFVKSFTEEDSNKATTTDHHDVSLVLDASADGKKLGEMYMKDGQIVLASFGGYYPLEVNDKKIKGHTKQECFTAYAAIKSALADVMQYQTENESDAGLKPLIAKLNKAYDAFVNTYGHFNKNNQLAWLRNDVDYPNVFSLETYKEQGDGKGGVVKTYDKADVMKGRVVEKESEPHPENVKDGVVVSMFKNGRIDVPYIASQLGKSETEVKREIIDSGLGFEDPTTRQMEVSYQYLSGNVREKLKQAEANNDNGEYSKNIKALQDVVPMNIPAHLIDFTLGSSWLDPKLYDEYVKERTDIDVHFTAAGGTWFMKAPTYGVNVEKNRAMGIVSEMLKKTIMGHELISAAIQNKSIIVSRTEKHYDGTTETITDREATAACAAKIDEIRQDFKDWARGKMQSDADLSARMEQEYNDRFNNYVPMSIPDDFVPEYFGGATHKFKMRSHQGKAIVRGTMQPLLLAHEVGTGKTFTLISTAMEMRRLGTARKPMIVVQNATVGQFAASAKELYPNAKILTLEDNDRNAEGRKNFYAKIKYNDWDMIVVPQSTFEFIPDSDERQMQFVQDKIDEKMLVLEQMREADSSGRDPITRRAEKELADLQAEMAALSEGISKKRTANNEKKKAVAKQNAAVKAQEMLDRRTDDVENFDDMGIDALLIDEAHEYKHLGFATAMQRGVKGVDPSYSKKSQGVYLKTQAILEKNNGRNVIFATGTPISNTAAEIWTFMRYLMPKDTMKEYGIYYFDDFVRNFGNIQQMPEFNTSGKFKEVNRFAGYVNLPELVRIWSGVADTVLTKDQTELVKKIPEMEGGKAQDIYLPQTRALRSVMKYVREELERFDQMSGKEKKENSSIPLTMYGIAQGAAVDARLVEMHAEDDPRSKTNEAVRQTLRSLKETDDYKGTVAIFADHYQNKRSGFNLYEDIKKKLIQQGVPESEVIVMKPGMTIKKKLEIFDKVNRGEVRVILGSTVTLGTGVNIQERLHTLIHLDAPNRPMDYTQRNGRILRQGNLHKQWNKPVRVLRFGVEDSLDVTAYQRLKTKGAIADSVMEGDRLMQDSMNNRVLEEEEDVFGDTVAQLSGSEYALLKNNAEKNVRKYESRKKQWEADQTYIHNAKPKLEGQIKAAEQRAEEANAQLLAVKKAFPDGKFTEITVGKLKFASVDAMADFIKEHNKKILDAVKAMKENPGNNVQTNALTLSLGGYDFVVKTEMSRETVNNGGLLFAEIHRRMSYSCPELGLNNVPVKQSLLRNAVEDITENVITGRDFAERFDIATRMVQHGKSELEQLKQREGKPFEFGKELEEAKRQFEEYSEAMKVEMAEKEKKYAEMDASVDAATDVVADDEDEAAEDKTKFRLLDADDPKAMELESLPESELVPVYRNVQAFEDDALGSPMAFTDAETGERRTLEGRRWNYSAPPKVELTEEQQRKLDELNKNGYIMVDGKKSTELQINDGLKFVKPKTKEAQLQYFLKKNPEDKGTWAAYDPYDHAIETPLNTQFGEAYKRPNLVVVRSLIPKSEIDEPFHADYALLPTGAHQWNNGRTLYLSRWSKIDKVLTREEEAKLIDEYWKKHPGKREELKTHRDYNRFVPQVRRELEKMGYRFELDGKELTPEESLALDKQNWESRDVIPGREGHTPFVSNEDIARINAKMAGKWVGEPKEAMESAMSERVTELSERLHTPVRIIRTEEEVAALPSVRQRRMKGSFNPMTGEVTIVVPNNANMADIENTFVHEVVGHDGLRVLFPDEAKLNNALDELYRVSKDEIRGTIDRMAQKMYDAEVDRIREKKRKEHVANGEDANASYYADMAAAHAEAGKKREQFKRDATEEYGADLAGRIGEKGFEKMSAEELTFWGKLKAMLQKALQKLLDGLKIPGKRKWGDKDWAFVLHEAYKRKKNGGKPTVFDAADTEVMRRKTGFGDTKFSDGYKKSAQPNEAALKHLEPIDVEHAAKDNHSPETDPDGGIMFRDGDMGLEETITKMKVEASQANADNWQAKQDAMRAIGGNLNKLRQAMARQRAYDLSTVKSITDLAKVLLENGLLDDLSKYETKRILSAVNNVHGKQDVSDYVQKVMDIMVDNQLRMGANQLGKLLSIRGSRVDARGIEVQGQLDPEGQRIAQVVRKATSLPKENIEERIADCTNRMSSDDNAVAEEAAIEYSGLLLAHQFVEDITESKAEEKALRESIKEAKADLDAGTMEADAYREYVESTNDAIRQNKIERAEAYRSIVGQVGGVLGGSVERAKAWREAEKQRVETIHHNANSDMTGRPNDEHHKESKAQKIANNSIVRFVLAPLGTFDQMLRMFGKKSVNGEGYLWNRYMRGWVEATEKEYTGYQNALKTLDEKVSEVFDKKMKWGDLFSLERNLPKATVTFWDGGEQKAHELTQGNLLYIYMVDKMADGRMKLRRMGITEEDVENIKEFVDPRFLELADWMQDEFLVEKRNEYNEVHKRMFGASMAAIENYFPLKILANARIEEVDVADDTTDTALPATSTGSIIKRRRNNLALDVMGADAFSVILDHIQQMERWASFAEFNRDLNTLLSYKRFRNQVMNMTSVYGGGKTLWKNFRNVCSMAAGAYRPPIAALDKAAVNVAKGVTAAKVSFRVFTALKQFLSMPAYLSDSSPVYLAGNIANPIGAWKWSMENLPLFEKRWKSRMAGDPRLMKSEMDWKMWQNRAVEIASRIGMSPNAFVDALTVAIGAHSMYQTKKKKYLRYGYDEETAEKRAKQDATILFNQTQQSSESAFLSTMQTDRSWLSVLFTVFRNSSMSYTRQLYDALRNLKHRFEPGYKGLTEEYLAKQMRRDGIDPDKADQNAKSEYRRSLMRDIVRVGVFGYLLQFAWNLGAYLPYLLLGDDKDEKSDMWHDIFCHTMFGSIEGLTGGDVMSAVGNGFAKGEGLNLFSASKDMPLSSDLQNIVNKWNKDKVAAMNDVTNLMVQSGIGVNPQSLTDAVVAIMDYCGDDANTSRECALLITRIINCPQSQIDKIYFDELNATAAEAQGMTPAEIAERYARYKMHRGAPLTGWAYTDEARDSVMTAQQNRVLTKAKEKLNSRMETEETKQLLSDYDAIAKQETALSKIKKTDRAAYREGMKQLRQSNDMRQHMRLKRYKHDMKELTSKYLRCKSAEERDSIVSTMFSTRAKMLEDIGRLKQQ
ncbi:MAG: ddrB-like ParB superfamily domain protein [Bacteriophage sp.]|nr:MAG: ddrB-like ParB superfamily domain protein [Bacteriophage sp.]